ncbi:MAG TPA: alpha/beta hydrolase [Verrucomicrobiae bacterium]|nr:alpha/beta hydrolase [Verrucomicrobiae bacterium]
MVKRKYIIDSGGNGETLVLLHGYLGSSRYWVRLKPLLLEAGYRVITIDLLGFGNAPKPRRIKYDYNDHIQHIQAAIESLHLQQPFTIVGHSMGALLALRYARLYPQQVKSLILLHQPLFKDRQEAVTSIRSTGRSYRFLLDSRFKRIGWLFVKALNYRHIKNHSPAAREGSLKNVIEAAEGLTDLTAVIQPALLVVGQSDRQEYAANATLFASTFSKTVTVLTVDTGHHAPYFQPKQTFTWLDEFLSKAK